MQKFTPFLMFEGQAEEAIYFYLSVFKHSHLKSIVRYGPNGMGKEGSVLHATFVINDQEFMAIDSSIQHNFSFTPSLSIYVQCESLGEIDSLFEKLSTAGKVMMPKDNYGFSEQFAWVADRFGVSWQLNLQTLPS